MWSWPCSLPVCDVDFTNGVICAIIVPNAYHSLSRMFFAYLSPPSVSFPPPLSAPLDV